ncbi:MAG: hypothetical protein ACLQGU_01950 [bacterium]
MKEIEDCIKKLRKLLRNREDKLSHSENLGAYIPGRIDVIRDKIDSLEFHLKKVEKNPVYRREVLKSFRAEAGRIKEEIRTNLSDGGSDSDT